MADAITKQRADFLRQALMRSDADADDIARELEEAYYQGYRDGRVAAFEAVLRQAGLLAAADEVTNG
jgi:hypothetical protein